jgi:hypothetical protein
MLDGYVICEMPILAASPESGNKSGSRKGSDNRIQSWPRSEVQENSGVLSAGLPNGIQRIEDIQQHHQV